MSVIDLPHNAVASAFTCPADGSYVGFPDEVLGRWRYFEILGKGGALEAFSVRSWQIKSAQSIWVPSNAS